MAVGKYKNRCKLGAINGTSSFALCNQWRSTDDHSCCCELQVLQYGQIEDTGSTCSSTYCSNCAWGLRPHGQRLVFLAPESCMVGVGTWCCVVSADCCTWHCTFHSSASFPVSLKIWKSKFSRNRVAKMLRSPKTHLCDNWKTCEDAHWFHIVVDWSCAT
jgi:hypothetical protein